MITSSMYSLIIYILTSTKREIEDTFFFFTEKIPSEIGARLKNVHYFSAKKHESGGRFMSRFMIRIEALYRWTFLKRAKIYGSDYLFFVSPLIKKRDMIVIEEGTVNYSREVLLQHKRKSRFKKVLYGPRINEPMFGASRLDKKVILTGLGPIPEEIKEKVELVNLRELWLQISDDYRDWVLQLFGLDHSKLEILKSRRAILLIQAFEKLGVEEDVVVETYRQIVKNVDPKDLVIKPHPSSTIDYSKIFPEAYIFADKIPMELLSFIGTDFKDAYTVCSTAVFSMGKETNIHFAGSSVHPQIEEAIGSVEYSDFTHKTGLS